MSSAQGVFTKMYEQAQQAEGAAAGAQSEAESGQSAPKDDNVVDGDYKEV